MEREKVELDGDGVGGLAEEKARERRRVERAGAEEEGKGVEVGRGAVAEHGGEERESVGRGGGRERVSADDGVPGERMGSGGVGEERRWRGGEEQEENVAEGMGILGFDQPGEEDRDFLAAVHHAMDDLSLSLSMYATITSLKENLKSPSSLSLSLSISISLWRLQNCSLHNERRNSC